MDKQTSDKLNNTLGQMGAIKNGHISGNYSSNSGQSSDMSFYVIMLGLIIGMSFYISYDKEQRYGASPTATVTDEPAVTEPAIEPVVVNIEKVKTVEIKPVAKIEATDSTPAAVVVEKIEQKTKITTAVVPVESAADIKADAPAPAPAPVAVAQEPATEIQAPAPAPIAQEPAPVVQAPASSVSSMMMPAMEAAKQAADVVAAPVVDAVETAAQTTDAVVTPVVQPAQAYNPYGYQYEQPQNNYYQQQPQYGNPYGNQYGNPYGNQYGNQYGNPYGYGNNPYQQPAQ